MIIKLANGSELTVLGVHGRNVNYQGVNRDSLILLFDVNIYTLTEISDLFTAENCATIALIDDGCMSLHENYTIRINAGVGYKDFVLRGNTSGDEQQQRVYIQIAQSTLAERVIENVLETVDLLVLDALIEAKNGEV